MNDQLPPSVQAAFARGALNRRTVMAGALGLGTVAALTACGSKGQNPTTTGTSTSTPTAKLAQDMSDTEKVVNWSNWPEYIDVDDKTGKHPTARRVHRSRPASRSTTPRTTTTTTSSTPRCARSSPRGPTPVATCGAAPTGWSPGSSARATSQKLDLANMPERMPTSTTPCSTSSSTRAALYSLPWQSGFAGIAYNPKATGGKKVTSVDQLLTDPALKGKVTLLTEMRDTVGLVLLALGKKIDELHRRRLPGGHRRAAEGQGRGPDQGLHRQRVHQAARRRGHRRLHRLDRRRRPAPARQPRARLRPPRHRMHPVVGQLRHPGPGAPQEERRDAHQLLLRPQGHGRGRRLRQLHLAGQGHQGDPGLRGPVGRQEPPDLPDQATLSRAHVFRGLTQEEETKYNRLFQTLVTGLMTTSETPVTCGSTGVTKRLRDLPRGRRHHPRDPAGLVLRAAGALRVRQDDDAAHGRRARAADERHDHHRGPGHHPAQAVPAQRQHRVPVLRALPAPGRPRERRVRPAPAR